MHRRDILTLFTSAASSVFVTAANAQSDKFDVKATAQELQATISTELKPPLARIGLVSFANQFRLARTKTKPLGYEDKPEFDGSYLRMISTLGQILASTNVNELSFRPLGSEYIDQMTRSYEVNAQSGKIKFVFESAREFAPLLRMLSDDQFSRYQLIIAIILQDRARNILDDIVKATCLFPLC